MADRYTGRHIRQARQARHGAWVNKKRSRTKPSPQLLPAAAAFTVAGLLFGGAGAAIHLNSASNEVDLVTYDPADVPPPDRTAQSDRVSRTVPRANVVSVVAPEEVGETEVQQPTRIIGRAPVITQTTPAPAPVATPEPAPASPEATPTPTPTATATPTPTSSQTPTDPGTGESGTAPNGGSCEATPASDGGASATDEVTATSSSLPVNSLVRVSNPGTGESVVVRITGASDSCLALSRPAFDAVADVGQTVVDVRYEVLVQDAT